MLEKFISNFNSAVTQKLNPEDFEGNCRSLHCGTMLYQRFIQRGAVIELTMIKL